MLVPPPTLLQQVGGGLLRLSPHLSIFSDDNLKTVFKKYY